jgi:CrcB protein
MAFLRPRIVLHPYYHLSFAVGFLGAYTTFSTFTFECLQLIQNGKASLALSYIIASVITGLLGVWLGFVLGELF